MITEDYCDFETAKLLKEKGFDVPTFWYYTESGALSLANVAYDWNHSNPLYNTTSAPTQQMAMWWLREVHHLLIMIDFECEDCYVADMYNMTEFDECGEHKHIPPTFVNCKTYEQACEAAIKYCLENLI